jgi:hypothetical protein
MGEAMPHLWRPEVRSAIENREERSSRLTRDTHFLFELRHAVDDSLPIVHKIRHFFE